MSKIIVEDDFGNQMEINPTEVTGGTCGCGLIEGLSDYLLWNKPYDEEEYDNRRILRYLVDKNFTPYGWTISDEAVVK